MYVGVLQPELGVAPEVSNSKVKNFLPLSLKNFSHKFQLQKKNVYIFTLNWKTKAIWIFVATLP